MTRKELIHVLQSGEENQQVMISGCAITTVDVVPALEGMPSYLDIVGQ